MTHSNETIERILNALQASVHHVQPKIAKNLEAHGVTPTQFFVLVMLRKKGSCTVSEIAEKMGVKPSAVTFLIDRLEQSEYVQRAHDKKDRRVVNVSLSEKGGEKFELLLKERKEIFSERLFHLTEEELEQFMMIAEKMATFSQGV